MIKKLLIVITILFCFITDESYGVNWPLRISASGKHLEDQSGVPFLIIGDAGWGLAVRLSQADIITYLNDRQSKGFTAIEVRIIDHVFCDNCPTNYNGDPPFCQNPTGQCTGVHYPWTNRNEAYWTNVDYLIDQAKNRGMVILAFPAYLGYDCGSQGWCADMQAQTNADMTSYGQWIGNRYKDKGNIIWMAGGDADASLYPNALARDTALVNAIRAADSDALFSAEPQNGQVGGIDSYASLLDINATYTYGTEETITRKAYQQSTRPFMLQEAYYENEHGTTRLDWQSQALITHLGGGLIGQVFGSCPLWHFAWSGGSGWCNSSSVPFNTWQNALNAPGSVSQSNIGKLMRSRRWWGLVPDYANTVVTSAKGSEVNYHATARETNGETVMVWCPDTNQVTVDMTKIGGTQAKAWWWNPDDNTSVLIGTYATTGTRNFTPSSARKVLVLDNAAPGLAAPGTTVYFSGSTTSSSSSSTTTSVPTTTTTSVKPTTTTTLVSTTTTSVLPSTTTTSVKSTTTTIVRKRCPFVFVFLSDGDTQKVEVLRAFRDKVLMNTPAGREYVLLFYKHSLEMTSLLFMNPDIALQSKEGLESIVPQLNSALVGNSVTIHPLQMDEIIEALDSISRKASPELDESIQRFKNSIRQGKVFDEMGIKVNTINN